MAMFDISISGSAGWQLSARNMCSHNVKCGTVVHNADICKSRFAVAANFAQRHKAWIQTQDTDTDTRYGHRHKAWTQTQDTDTDTKHEHRCKTRMLKFEIYKRVGQHSCKSV